jgi:hypothetical protein
LEAYNLKQVLLNALKMNKEYLLATQVVSRSLPTQISLYSSKEKAFLAISNKRCLSAIDPRSKSKQAEFQLIYEIGLLIRP